MCGCLLQPAYCDTVTGLQYGVQRWLPHAPLLFMSCELCIWDMLRKRAHSQSCGHRLLD